MDNYIYGYPYPQQTYISLINFDLFKNVHISVKVAQLHLM